MYRHIRALRRFVRAVIGKLHADLLIPVVQVLVSVRRVSASAYMQLRRRVPRAKAFPRHIPQPDTRCVQVLCRRAVFKPEVQRRYLPVCQAKGVPRKAYYLFFPVHQLVFLYMVPGQAHAVRRADGFQAVPAQQRQLACVILQRQLAAGGIYPRYRDLQVVAPGHGLPRQPVARRLDRVYRRY